MLTLTKALDADFVVVSEVDLVNELVHTIAVSAGGEPAEPFTYQLRGTPCEKAVNGDVCVFPTQ